MDLFDPIAYSEELDRKLEQYQKMSLNEQGRESSIERSNLTGLDAALKQCKGHCGNPDCNWPLADDNYRVLGFGDVCRLCFDLYHAVNDRRTFVEAHRAWYAAETDRKRLMKNNEKGNDPYQY